MDKRPRAYIGIDPGISKSDPGAACLLGTQSISFSDWQSENAAELRLIEWGQKYNILGIAIEEQHARPGEGHSSKLIENFGYWKGISRIIMTPKIIRAQEWQQIIPPQYKGEKPKDRYLPYVRDLYPDIADLLKFKKYSGRAAALLIAYYLRRVDNLRRTITGSSNR